MDWREPRDIERPMIALIGLDYRHSSAEQRGRLSFSGERLRAAVKALTGTGDLTEAVILSTCNRTEIYYASPATAQGRTAAIRLIAEAYQCGPETIIERIPVERSTDDLGQGLPAWLEDDLYEYGEAAAAQHLFGVAAGLRSMVIGEAQILGQVKDALIEAEAAHTVGDELRAMFTTAIKVGKRARAETSIGRADASVAALAVEVAEESLGGLAGKSALIIGAGRTSQLCAELLRSRGIGRLALANRSASAARELARRVDGEPISMSGIPATIQTTQLIISATAAPHPILHASTVARGMADRAEPLLIVDLAAPPDVEADVAELPGVFLFTLDALRTRVGFSGQALNAPREQELAAIEAMIEQGVRDFLRGRAIKQAVPTIAGLRRHVDRSEQAELARALAQLGHLSEQDRQVIERFGQRLVDKMFFHLVSRIRSLAEHDEMPLDVTMRVLGQLFTDPEERRGATELQPKTPTADSR